MLSRAETKSSQRGLFYACYLGDRVVYLAQIKRETLSRFPFLMRLAFVRLTLLVSAASVSRNQTFCNQPNLSSALPH